MSIAGKDAPPLDGSLALDIFADKAITIEQAKHDHLIVETEASLAARTRHAIEVPIRLVREAEGVALSVVVGVPTSKGLAWMEALDTGNDDPVIVVSKYIAPLLGVYPASDSSDRLRSRWRLASYSRAAPELSMTLSWTAISGIPFLRAWNIALDLKHGRAWFAPVNR